MTKEVYAKMTALTRRTLQALPGGEHLLHVPTFLCAGLYLPCLVVRFLQRDPRWLRAALVPAATFLIVTVLRPIIGRARPYDVFGIPPVGKWTPGKGKSMPSRHAASAAAIAIAVSYLFPFWPIIAAMVLLGAGIALLRVVTGQHFPSDVAAAALLAFALSAIGYGI